MILYLFIDRAWDCGFDSGKKNDKIPFLMVIRLYYGEREIINKCAKRLHVLSPYISICRHRFTWSTKSYFTSFQKQTVQF